MQLEVKSIGTDRIIACPCFSQLAATKEGAQDASMTSRIKDHREDTSPRGRWATMKQLLRFDFFKLLQQAHLPHRFVNKGGGGG